LNPELREVKKQTLLRVMVILLAIVCGVGAGWTAYWSSRFGLAARAPLSPFQTAVRFAGVALAVILLLFRRDTMERTTLICAVVAAGSSALFGLGLRSTTLDVVRLLFHFFAYALGVVVCVRWLARLRQTRNAYVAQQLVRRSA
jgi:presenilin-like A22 family membrane protease